MCLEILGAVPHTSCFIIIIAMQLLAAMAGYMTTSGGRGKPMPARD